MKRVLIIFTLILSMTLCSCSEVMMKKENEPINNESVENEELKNTETADIADIEDREYLKGWGDAFDYEIKHRPTVEEIESVPSGTSMEEVVKIIGKPHDVGPHSGLLSVVWFADNNEKYLTIVCYPSDAEKGLSTEDILTKYGIVSFFRRLD